LIKKHKKGFVVAIDGPAGAGKSTVSKQLAEELDGVLLDTGGMYRCVAFQALKFDVDSAAGLGFIARKLEFGLEPKTKTLLVDGKHLGTRIRTQEVSDNASKISRFRSVRSVLTRQQRKLGKKLSAHYAVVVEGRDIGTVVFPDAPFKFFVTASEEVRAKRRLSQLKKQGYRGTLKEVLRENNQRDRQDSQRKIAPLRCAEDAVIVDTSAMSIGKVVSFMREHIMHRLELSKPSR